MEHGSERAEAHLQALLGLSICSSEGQQLAIDLVLLRVLLRSTNATSATREQERERGSTQGNRPPIQAELQLQPMAHGRGLPRCSSQNASRANWQRGDGSHPAS